MIQEMTRLISSSGGVAVLDICRFNEEAYALPEAIERVIRTVFPAGATRCRLDEQTYWSYEF